MKYICLCYFTALNLDQSADDGSNQCLRLVNHHKKKAAVFTTAAFLHYLGFHILT
ncbi:hypothetical protein HMPREF1241_0238 [Streptococcus pyogenes GA03799]|nr:hypothetical protein HMPREF1241_0238 [Streptococcus pyogenes GA03799]